MRYRIDVPKPSAKRLEKDRRLIITICGWHSAVVQEHLIPEGVDEFEFDFDRPIKHRDPDVLDGDFYHVFEVKYQNSTGTRWETIRMNPEPVSDI